MNNMTRFDITVCIWCDKRFIQKDGRCRFTKEICADRRAKIDSIRKEAKEKRDGK